MALKGAKARAALALAGMFALGGLTGAGLTRWMHLRGALAYLDAAPDEGPRRALETALRHRLGLDDVQSQRLHEILRVQAEGQRGLRRRVEPEARALRMNTAARIREVLRPEQVREFDRLLGEHERRLTRWLQERRGAD
jgi:hypothetical protein